MKKIFLVLLLTSFIPCTEIQYDGETKLVFKTTVVDANGQPLPNSTVDIQIDDQYASDIISTGRTKANGEIVLVFPSPKYDLDINLKVYNDDIAYLEQNILRIKKGDFTHFKLEFPMVYLLKNEDVAALNLTYSNTSPNTTMANVRIIGIHQSNPQYYGEAYDYYEVPTQILIKKNQNFQLQYTTQNLTTGVKTSHTVDLQIGTDAINYTINY